jgi:hypothetical protein
MFLDTFLRCLDAKENSDEEDEAGGGCGAVFIYVRERFGRSMPIVIFCAFSGEDKMVLEA